MSAHIAPLQWQAEAYEADTFDAWATTRHAPLRIPALIIALLFAAGLPAAAWVFLRPATTVETRFLADTSGPSARAALAEAALRLAAVPSAMTRLDGEFLVVTVAGQDATDVRILARSIAATVLDMHLPSPTPPVEDFQAASRALPPAMPAPNPAAAERARLQSSLEAADNRLGVLSTALTGVARDLAAGTRVSPDRSGERENLDKAAATLAGLQLQRIQLQSRYQDDFPAVATLDAQIRSVRAFIGEETRRVEAASKAAPDLGTPILSAERDRLRAEQAQWLDRRAALAGELVAAGRLTADRARAQPPPDPAPAPAPAATPTPLLVEAATVVASAPDSRWWAVPVAAGAGLVMTLGAWHLPRHRSRAVRAELLLQQVQAMLLAQAPAVAEPQTDGLLLSRTRVAMLLDPPR